MGAKPLVFYKASSCVVLRWLSQPSTGETAGDRSSTHSLGKASGCVSNTEWQDQPSSAGCQ